ncbi:transcription factor TFIID-domain-containing protein [Diaporthe sp. PMI_573]|nr:transcription factor TFIID-domain-containing protein [Diaporthaceae sp. PMI_573]
MLILHSLRNIVMIINLDCYLPLFFIPVMYSMICKPKTTALIFASGKIVATSAKSEDNFKLAGLNIVGFYNIYFLIYLKGLASQYYNFSSYKPKLFPGLIYCMVRPKVVLLIFVSGKIIITSAKV